MPVKMIYRLRDRAWGGRLKDLRFVSAQKRQSRGRSWRQGASFTGEPGPQAGSMKSPWGCRPASSRGLCLLCRTSSLPMPLRPAGPPTLKRSCGKKPEDQVYILSPAYQWDNEPLHILLQACAPNSQFSPVSSLLIHLTPSASPSC